MVELFISLSWLNCPLSASPTAASDSLALMGGPAQMCVREAALSIKLVPNPSEEIVVGNWCKGLLGVLNVS